jgi:hypothetical protein
MDGQRDYQEWHRAYDDPDSALSWRLRTVQEYLREAIDRSPGAIRVVSACSGDGRDIIGVLSPRHDADRVSVTMIELHPDISQQAREAADAAGLAHVEVRTADAGVTDSYRGAVPAEVVLLVGIFGNISDTDLEQTIRTAPQFCSPGATLVWSRGRHRDDRNDAVRAWFATAGFSELAYAEHDTGRGPALGVMRYDGEPQSLVAGRRLFTFLRGGRRDRCVTRPGGDGGAGSPGWKARFWRIRSG